MTAQTAGWHKVGSVAAVLRRSIAEGKRDPGPALFLPALPSIIMTIGFTSLFRRLADVLELTTGSYEAYVVPGLVIAVAMLAGGFTSAQLAQDMRSGFVDRLRLFRPGIPPLILGRFVYEGVRVIPAAVIVLTLGLIAGGRNDNGVAGVVVIVLLAVLLSAAFAGLHLTIGALSEDPNTPLNLQPIGILLIFLSTAIVPLDAFPGWAEAIARYNPVTPLANAGRAALVGDVAGADVAFGFLVGVVWLVISIVVAIATVTKKVANG